jgi:phosphoglucosamine mutase
MSRRYFGTDGVRGVANEQLTPEFALALGAAAGRVLRRLGQESESAEVIVGRDPRLSSDMLVAALTAGLLTEGLNVLDIGVAPTPAVAFLALQRGAIAGAMVSASHNPFYDNGIKFFGGNGRKLSDTLEMEIEAALGASSTRPTHAGIGRSARSSDPIITYVNALAETLAPQDLKGMKLVVDTANGAASYLAGPLLRALGAEVITVADQPSGININASCGALHPEAMAHLVVENNAHAGLAFDGDADRLILADSKGRIFNGDRVLLMAGLWKKAKNELPNAVVVGTVMSNLGLEKALESWGIQLVRAKVGDRYVAEEMMNHGAVIGGEQSGHILFGDLTTTGDGLLTALQVLKIVRASGIALHEWADKMRDFPQVIRKVETKGKSGIEQSERVQAAVRQVENHLAGRGRINVRPSGTEPVIRVMVEGENEAEVTQIADALIAVVQSEVG